MVTISRQATLRTLMPTLAQSLWCACSADACLTRAAWSNLRVQASSILSFVRYHLQELRPSGVIDGLRQHPACESFNIQVFYGNHAVVIYQPSRNLVVKVRALIADVCVRPLEQLHGFTSAVRTFLTTGYSALCVPQLNLRFSVPAWVINHHSVTQGSKREQANIHADSLGAWRQWFRFALYREASKPTSGFTLDSERLNLTFNQAMQFYLDLADFRERQLRALNRKAKLWVGERIITRMGAEARKASFSFALHAGKERLERLINSVQRVLQHLRIDAVQFGTCLFDVGKLCRLRGEVDGFTIDAPSIAPFLQCRVVEFLAKTKRLLKQRGLLPSWFSHAVQPSTLKGLVRAGDCYQQLSGSSCIIPQGRFIPAINDGAFALFSER
jgi:hypothetical protein